MLFSYIAPTKPSETDQLSFAEWSAAARVAVALVLSAIVWLVLWGLL
jgi:hypothetical protein